jgi:hypothetical protein
VEAVGVGGSDGGLRGCIGSFPRYVHCACAPCAGERSGKGDGDGDSDGDGDADGGKGDEAGDGGAKAGGIGGGEGNREGANSTENGGGGGCGGGGGGGGGGGFEGGPGVRLLLRFARLLRAVTAADRQLLQWAAAPIDIPHHCSSEAEVTRLLDELRTFLETSGIPRPAVVTVARSAADGYTPAGKVTGGWLRHDACPPRRCRRAPVTRAAGSSTCWLE